MMIHTCIPKSKCCADVLCIFTLEVFYFDVCNKEVLAISNALNITQYCAMDWLKFPRLIWFI